MKKEKSWDGNAKFVDSYMKDHSFLLIMFARFVVIRQKILNQYMRTS